MKKDSRAARGQDGISRRNFVKAGGAALGGAALGGAVNPAGAADLPDRNRQEPRVQEYRRLGRTDFQASDIGFGAGPLDNANVLAAALDMGVNYIDTAESYVNGQSERTVGEVMSGRDRSSVFITTKIHLAAGGTTQEAITDRIRGCLERMQTDYADCVMIHAPADAEEVRHEGFHGAVAELKAEGRIRFTGLSNHGVRLGAFAGGGTEVPMDEVIRVAADDGRFDVVLFTYNFLQQEQGQRIIDMCSANDMGVTLMKTNPVALWTGLSEQMEQMREAGQEIPEAMARGAEDYGEWIAGAEEFKQRHGLLSNNEVRDAAIKFVLDNPGVHSVCGTINTFDALEAFLALSGQRLTGNDNSMLASYDELLGRFYCRHACGICEPSCPENVPVNTIMRYGHYFNAQGREKQAMLKYASLPQANAEGCQNCSGKCESACPHGVPVRSLLARTHQNLTLV